MIFIPAEGKMNTEPKEPIFQYHFKTGIILATKKTKLHGLSPRVNYTNHCKQKI
jgi:hypothetical protein